MNLYEKFSINKLRDITSVRGGARIAMPGVGGVVQLTEVTDDNRSTMGDEKDCTIDTGQTCDYTTTEVDCPIV